MYGAPYEYGNTVENRILKAPSHIDLVGAEIEMLNLENREKIMRRALEPMKSEWIGVSGN